MNLFTRRGLTGLALGGAVAGASRGAAAQAWPARPVTIVVPFPAGGATDVMARALARGLSDSFGQPFVVENRSGANGNIGTNAVAKAAPDGHTLLVTTNGPITNNTLLYRSMPYDPFAELSPIAMLAELPVIIAARPNLPYRNVQELVAFARANPGKVNCGLPGNGAIAHLASELLQHRANIRFTQIPYRGSAPLTNDLLAGAVDIAFDLVTTYLPHIQAGTVRALGVTATSEVAQLPGVPPVQAQGIADYQATGWIAILAPARTPDAVGQRLNTAANAWLREEANRRILGNLGLTPLGGTAEEVAARMRAEVTLWRPIVQAANITAE
jgi:tripartite-type tricarboxylate transporter receptor subunit TctC